LEKIDDAVAFLSNVIEVNEMKAASLKEAAPDH
jgi:hypothetical protein